MPTDFGRTWPYRFWNGPSLLDEDWELGDDHDALEVAARIREHGGCVTRIERHDTDGLWRTTWTLPYPWEDIRAS
ncbi:hypothetical protein [Streptomyces sp. NPDC037389]|uniref:hypothetical protein n=1 Tax=Streptomyces sp. NPDC037389 TaxID=3155369 RepID=UPI003400B65F